MPDKRVTRGAMVKNLPPGTSHRIANLTAKVLTRVFAILPNVVNVGLCQRVGNVERGRQPLSYGSYRGPDHAITLDVRNDVREELVVVLVVKLKQRKTGQTISSTGRYGFDKGKFVRMSSPVNRRDHHTSILSQHVTNQCLRIDIHSFFGKIDKKSVKGR